jgi:hypothetical protein
MVFTLNHPVENGGSGLDADPFVASRQLDMHDADADKLDDRINRVVTVSLDLAVQRNHSWFPRDRRDIVLDAGAQPRVAGEGQLAISVELDFASVKVEVVMA